MGKGVINLQTNRWYNYFVVIVLILLGIWLWRRGRQPQDSISNDTDAQEVESRANDFLSQSGYSLPENATRANLSDPTGSGSTGIATRDDNQNYSIIASLPNIESGWYQAWLTTSDGSHPVSLGSLTLAKGGFLLETQSSLDPSSYTQIKITREQVRDDNPEFTVLEGHF